MKDLSDIKLSIIIGSLQQTWEDGDFKGKYAQEDIELYDLLEKECYNRGYDSIDHFMDHWYFIWDGKNRKYH